MFEDLRYTDPPERVAAAIRVGNGAMEALHVAEELLARLPESKPAQQNRDGEIEHLGSAVATHRFVSAPGDSETVRWHYVETGNASNETIVFLHGVPDSWWQWHYALEALSDRYHCVAVDLKGYGQSDKRSGDYRQAGVAAQLEALLDEIQVDRFVLVTHDRGTPPGDHLVANVGDRVIGYARGQQHLWHLNPSLHPQQDLFLSPDAHALLGDARRFVTTAYTWLTESPIAQDDLMRTIEEFGHPGVATAVPRYFHASSFRQEWIDRRRQLIPSWRAPVLLLQGAKDPLQPREFYLGPEILESLPAGSDVHIFDTGHFWPFEAPRETVEVIGSFCDRVTDAVAVPSK